MDFKMILRLRFVLALVLSPALFLGPLAPTTLVAQEEVAPTLSTPIDARASTGGAQTLADIMARQQSLNIDDRFRSSQTGNPEAAQPLTDQLGVLGGTSDAEIYRAIRYGTASVTASNQGPAAAVLIQDGGMRWLDIRQGPLLQYGGYLLLGMIALLALFYLLRGKIRIEGERSGDTILRFKTFERFSHWLMAGSFLVLAVTGLISLFGRLALIPLIGRDAYAPLAQAGKWIHNNIAWAFMLSLIFILVLWVKDNLPHRVDFNWLLKGGGLFTRGSHPPAKKFNAGEKIIFWLVILLGASISISGLSLLFPFELPLFAKTFGILNDLGLPQLLGFGELNATMSPQEEMQWAQLWHAIIAFVFIAIIIAHIYLGSIGMEGAFDSMNSGNVDVQWAKEHHSLWHDEVMEAPTEPAQADDSVSKPAE